MKNAMKKLMSLLLVAVLLVSAVPFQADATEGVVRVQFKVDGAKYGDVVEVAPDNGESAVVGNLLTWHISKVGLDANDYQFVNAYAYRGGNNGDVGIDGVINVGEAVHINVTPVKKDEGNEGGETGNSGSNADTTVTPATNKVTIVVKKDGVEGAPYEVEIKNASTTVQNLITHKVDADEIAGMNFATAYTNAGGYMGLDGTVNAGEKVYIAYSTPAAKVAPINIVVKVESSNNVVWTGTKVPANGKNAVVENLLTYCWNSSWDDVYTVDHVWSSEQQKNVARGETVNAGDTVSFLLNEKNPTTTTTTTTNKFPYNVYLNIYKDTKVGSPDKCVDITNGIALDGVVSLDEVKTVVANYYNANNSYGIGYDGLYLAKGNWVANYVADTQKYDKIDAGSMKQTGYVYINVMITNATAKSTATADSTNPKTGDDIYVAMTVMGISAAALATAMYVFTKKRVVK